MYSARDERAERREKRRKLFYEECDAKLDACKRAKEEQLMHKKAMDMKLTAVIYEVENRLVALKMNGLKNPEDIKVLSGVNFPRYILAFAAYLDAFELYEACLVYGIYHEHMPYAADVAHFMGHKDFLSKAKSRGWKTSGLNESMFGRSLGAAAMLTHERPYSASYCLRPLPELLQRVIDQRVIVRQTGSMADGWKA